MRCERLGKIGLRILALLLLAAPTLAQEGPALPAPEPSRPIEAAAPAASAPPAAVPVPAAPMPTPNFAPAVPVVVPAPAATVKTPEPAPAADAKIAAAPAPEAREPDKIGTPAEASAAGEPAAAQGAQAPTAPAHPQPVPPAVSPIVPAGSPPPAPAEPPVGSATLHALRQDLRAWAARTSALVPRLREPFAPALREFDRVVADPAAAAKRGIAWAQTDVAQQFVLPGGAALLLAWLAFSLLRGWGDAAVAIEFPTELRGAFSVHLSRSKKAAGRIQRTGTPAAAQRARKRASASNLRHHHMVSRETQFRGLRSGRWWVTVDGYLQPPGSEEVLATHFAEQELLVRRGDTARIDFDFRPKDCPVDVKVVWDKKPVPDALVSVRDVPYSLRFTRGGVVRVGVGRGRHTLVVGHGDRVAEHTLEVASFQPTSVVVDLGSREHLVFVGCPPAVEPYLHGDVPAAARALARDGHTNLSERLLARIARERGQLATAAEHLERGGDLAEAAKTYADLSQWKQAARLYESAGDLEHAAEMFQAAGEHVRAGESFQRVGRHDEAADSFREADDLPRWVESLERSGRPFEAAKVAIEREDWGRAIRSLQLVTPADAEYLEAAKLLIDAYQREGHLDLATRKIEELVTNKGPDAMPLDTCDTLARRLEEKGDFEHALVVLELIRSRDATWPNVATRIEGLRKRRSGSQNAAAGGAPPALDPFGEAARYEVLEELGRGGMGIVFKARDRRLGRVVALKRLPDSLRNHPKAVELFLREARAAAALNHPNIVTLFDAGQDGDAYYITMELLEGMPLTQILRQRGRLGPRDAAKLGIQIANGLQYAHENRIVHRDIKTGNLFFTRGKAVKIMDFGLAKMVEEVRRATTVIGGTPYYMAPEQSLGEAVDQRADLYALGVTFYELLTGRVPFKDGDVAFHHRHTPVPDPRELVAELPAAWCELVLALLAKAADDRPASAALVAERLAPLSQAPSR